MNKIEDHMSNNFQVIHTSFNLNQAINELPKETYVVIHDEIEPKALIFGEDLHQAANNGISSIASLLQQLPPTVVVGREVEINQLANSSVMTLFDVGAKGAIVLGKQGVVGVLPREVIDEFIVGGMYRSLDNVLGENVTTKSITDGILGGDYQTPIAIKICAYPGCGFPNQLVYFDPDYPPKCQNLNLPEHSLKLT